MLLGIVTGAMFAFCLVYAQTVGFNFINYDDYHFIRDNPNLRAGWSNAGVLWALTANFATADSYAEYWMPVTLLARLTDFQLFDTAPGGQHAVSALIHLLNAGLFFLFSRATTRSCMAAALAAVIFAFHPVNVEVTCWLAARKDLLAGTFSLLTLIAYLRFGEKRTTARYLACLGLFALALMAKPSAISLPAALLLLDGWPLGRIANPRQCVVALVEKAPFGLLALVVTLITYVGQSELGGVGNLVDAGPTHRLLEGVVGYARYALHLVCPVELSVLYPALRDAPGWSLWLPAASGLVGMSWFAIRARFSRPILLVGWLWFLLVLFPLMGVVGFGRQSIADRYLYVASLGLILAVASILQEGIEHLVREERGRLLAGVAVAVSLTLLLGEPSRRQVVTWKDSSSVWQQALKVDPQNGYAWVSFGTELANERRWPEADAAFRKALTVNGAPYDHLVTYGVALFKQRRLSEAASVFEQCVRMEPFGMKAHDYLITTLEALNQPGFVRSTRLRRQLVRTQAMYGSAATFWKQGDRQLALEQIELAAWAQFEAERLVSRRAPVIEAEAFVPALEQTGEDGRLFAALEARLRNDRALASTLFERLAGASFPPVEPDFWRAVARLEDGRHAEAEALWEQLTRRLPVDSPKRVWWSRIQAENARAPER